MAEPSFASGRQSLPTDEAGFRVAEPTFDEAQTLFVISGDRANLRWITTYTLSTMLNQKTNTYKDTYLIGAIKLQGNTHLVVANLAHSTYTHLYHALGCVWDGVE